MVVCVYFTNWSIYARGFTPAQMPLELVSHVIYAFLKPDVTTGEVVLSDPWADVQKPMENGGQGCIGEFNLLKRQYPFKLIASIGGYTYSSMLSEVLTSPSKRMAFVQSVVDLVAMHNFDGIDIDWEYPSTYEEKQALYSTLNLLRDRLDSVKVLMVAAPATTENLETKFPMEIDRFIDFWNIMAYDYYGPWSKITGNHAQLYCLDSELCGSKVVEQYTQYVPAGKLVLGIPLYGRSFANTKGLHYPFCGTLPGEYENGVHDYKTLPLSGFMEHTDLQTCAAVCQTEDAVVSYDNIQTVMQKAKYVVKTGLGGAMFWEASGDKNGELVRAFVHVEQRKINMI